MKHMKRIFVLASVCLSLKALPAEPAIGSKMQAAANQFLQTLSEKQLEKLQLDFNSSWKAKWKFEPEPTKFGSKLGIVSQPGLRREEMTEVQLKSLESLLSLGMNASGLDIVRTAILLEQDNSLATHGLRDKLLFNYSDKNYFVTFFGSPSDAVWAWRFQGHHISLTFLVNSALGTVEASPAFLGTRQSQVTVDAEQKEILKEVVEKAKAYVSSLDAEQIKGAKQSRIVKGNMKKVIGKLPLIGDILPALKGQDPYHEVPILNLFAPSLKGEPAKIQRPLPKGLAIEQMSETQQQMLVEILNTYQRYFSSELTNESLKRINAGAISDLEFVLGGDPSFEEAFYFRIQGNDFVLEFNTSENSADHYHAVWLKY
jgi:hypothetical protein